MSILFNICLCCWGKLMSLRIGFREPHSPPVRLLMVPHESFSTDELTNYFCSLSISPFMTLWKRPGGGNSDCFMAIRGYLKHAVAVTHLKASEFENYSSDSSQDRLIFAVKTAFPLTRGGSGGTLHTGPSKDRCFPSTVVPSHIL